MEKKIEMNKPRNQEGGRGGYWGVNVRYIEHCPFPTALGDQVLVLMLVTVQIN
jgi:hypothetical protein